MIKSVRKPNKAEAEITKKHMIIQVEVLAISKIIVHTLAEQRGTALGLILKDLDILKVDTVILIWPQSK